MHYHLHYYRKRRYTLAHYPSRHAMNKPSAKPVGTIGPKKKGVPSAAVSLTEEAYRLLKWKILSMELAPGTFINEQGLVEATGFGRAPIHQALHQLQYDGLVEIRPRKGAQVKVWSPARFRAIDGSADSGGKRDGAAGGAARRRRRHSRLAGDGWTRGRP